MNSTTDFRISALDFSQFEPLFSLPEDKLAARGARRCTADSSPGYPCRVSLADANIGETVITIPWTHHPVAGPYRSSGPVFVRENAVRRMPEPNEIPEFLLERQLSLRGYDTAGLMCTAAVVNGKELDKTLGTLFCDSIVDYIHVHNAAPGCYMCRIDRVSSVQ